MSELEDLQLRALQLRAQALRRQTEGRLSQEAPPDASPVALPPPHLDAPGGGPQQEPQQDTGVLGHGVSGFNSGLASLAGMPVDVLTGVGNAMQVPEYVPEGLDENGRPTGLVLGATPQISNPVGGGQQMRELMSPLMAQDAPNTLAERFAQAIGQDLGASAVPALGMASRAQAPLRVLGLEAASSVGAGSGAQAAEELGAGPTGQMLAALAGGGAPIAANGIMTRPDFDPLTEAGIHRNRAYSAVEESDFPITSTEGRELTEETFDRLSAARMNENLHNRANTTLGMYPEFMPENASAYSLEELRRYINENPGDIGAGRAENRYAGIMRETLDESLEGMAAERGSPFFDNLLEARAAHSQERRLSDLLGETGAMARAERRAATSGTGGNQVNAIRQNIRRILDSDRLRRGYSPEEIEAMEAVVHGTPFGNRMRELSGLSPTRGALQMAGNAAAAGTGLMTGGTPGLLMATLPGIAGMGAGRAANASTQRSVDELLERLSAGLPRPSPVPNDTTHRALIASLLGLQAQGQTGTPGPR